MTSELAKMDERQQFSEVVLPFLDDALSLARWLAGNITDAEDIVQEASVRAYQALQALEVSHPRAWLLGIVRNTAFTWLARNRPKAVVITNDDSVFEREAIGTGSMETPETILISKSDSDDLREAIAGLPQPFREALVLREIDDLSYREISEVLSIPIGTVMSRLARARSMLIQRLGAARLGKGAA